MTLLKQLVRAFGLKESAAGRLFEARRDSALTAHYEYDSNGNRLAGPGLTSAPVYDAQDRLLSYGPCTYTYKPSGELLTKTCPEGVTTYDYDPFGALRGVTSPNGTAITYVIDGQNRRVGKKVNGVLVEGWLYRNGLQPVAWLDASGAVKAQFIYAGGNGPAAMIAGGKTYRFVKDQVGSIREVVDSATGLLIERVDYDDFGNVLADTAPGTTPFGFASGLRDVDTGLTRFGARDYDSITGRWTAKDPSGFEGGGNFYQYASSDPVNFLDPDGQSALAATWVLPLIPALPGIGAAAGVGWAAGWVLAAGALGYAIGTGINYFAGDYIQQGLDIVFSGPRRAEPHPDAVGPHCTAKRRPGGRITGYTEFDENGRAVKRFRGEGKPHDNVEPPFILEPQPGKGAGAPPKVPRPPTPDELPSGY